MSAQSAIGPPQTKYQRWELLGCGLKGSHLTYEPTDNERAASHLSVPTSDGTAWRCLRCGTFVAGEPTARGPLESAPSVARGRAAKQLFIIRALAVERIFRSLVLLLVGYGIFKFRAEESALQNVLNRDLPILKQLGANHHWDVDSSGLFKLFHELLNLNHETLTWIGIGIIAYGLVEGVEGVGLWMSKRWGEYLTVVATAAFLPLEVWELTNTVSLLKIIALVINLAAVVWLIYAKRLFGFRNGAAGYAQEIHAESFIELEAAGSY